MKIICGDPIVLEVQGLWADCPGPQQLCVGVILSRGNELCGLWTAEPKLHTPFGTQMIVGGSQTSSTGLWTVLNVGSDLIVNHYVLVLPSMNL